VGHVVGHSPVYSAEGKNACSSTFVLARRNKFTFELLIYQTVEYSSPPSFLWSSLQAVSRTVSKCAVPFLWSSLQAVSLTVSTCAVPFLWSSLKAVSLTVSTCAVPFLRSSLHAVSRTVSTCAVPLRVLQSQQSTSHQFFTYQSSAFVFQPTSAKTERALLGALLQFCRFVRDAPLFLHSSCFFWFYHLQMNNISTAVVMTHQQYAHYCS
jgi:hypothetical protein